MKIFEFLSVSEAFPNPVLTIGNYDGIHLGHKKIIEKVKERARAISGTSMLMTFEPHPLCVLKPGKNIGLITPLHVKKRLIEETGIDALYIVPFNDEFRQITADSFVKDILIGKLGIKGLIVGYDFRFGKEGLGNAHLLTYYAEQYGFFFEVVRAITLNGEKVGSNRIRKMIKDGQVEKARKHLERPFMIEGVVVKGANRGKDIGFPTINLETDFELIPKTGVYISEVGLEGKRFPSVTNIGYNPTFDNGRTLSIETYILNFSEDLYDKRISLYFYERIRDEIRFHSVNDLKNRIGMDVEMAREHFGLDSEKKTKEDENKI